MNIHDYAYMHHNFLNQIPSCLILSTLKQEIAFANDSAAKIMGFKSGNDAVNTHYSNIRCKAAEDAELFAKQDNLVIAKEKAIKTIGYHRYQDNDDWTLVLCEKSPLLKDNEFIGLMTYWWDVTYYNIIDFSRFLYTSTKKVTSTDSCSFIIDDEQNNQYDLSNRQLECLFFLLRGQTSKRIAEILSLSPRTVEDYINEIKFKMHCFTRSQIIEKAINEGMIHIIPKTFFKHAIAPNI